MKFCIRKNLGNLFMACCAAALSTTALATASTTHNVTINNNVDEIVTETAMNITLTEAELQAIRDKADGARGNYVQLGSTQLCVASNDEDGLPVSVFSIGQLTGTFVDSTGSTVNSTAEVAALMHSKASFDGIDVDYNYNSLGGQIVLIAGSSMSINTNYGFFDEDGAVFALAYPTTGVHRTALSNAISSSGVLVPASANLNAGGSNGTLYLRHIGIQDVSSASTANTTTDPQNVTVSNCADSLLEINLFVSADDAIDLTAGSYTTSITVSFAAETSTVSFAAETS